MKREDHYWDHLPMTEKEYEQLKAMAPELFLAKHDAHTGKGYEWEELPEQEPWDW